VVPYQLLFNAWVERLYLEDLLPLTNLAPNLAILRFLVLPDPEAGLAAQSILADIDSEAEFRRRLDLVEAILVNRFPLLTIEEVRQMLNLREASVRETRFFQEVLQEGRQEGRQEGEVFDSAVVITAMWCGFDRATSHNSSAADRPVGKPG
jgi:predicted transposase YdaD